MIIFQELLEANLDTEAGPDIADPNSFSEGEFRYSYNKQLSVDIKMYNFKIKTSFVSPEILKARLTKLFLIL